MPTDVDSSVRAKQHFDGYIIGVIANNSTCDRGSNIQPEMIPIHGF
ncbi:hypothetical protein RintRC_4294 [Richelia intracellularis]|nr:hypothetical protein RintRC_4294 [Richelia intracellularis]